VPPTTAAPRLTATLPRAVALASGMLATLLLVSCGGGGSAVSTSPLTLAATGGEPCSAFGGTPTYNPHVRSPQTVLGFDLGSREVTPTEAGRLIAALAADSGRVWVGTAGQSVLETPLDYAIVGNKSQVSESALAHLSREIRQLMDPETSPEAGQDPTATLPAVFWLGGNVHGNEESGADASLQVLYELAAREDCAAQRIRDNSIVVVLPIQNPDGRAAGTRRNAYGFDLNRDWFARTQPETDGKLALMQQYPPQLFIDAHEMGSKNFFFPPTADPAYHEVPSATQSWVNRLFSPAISAEFDRQKIPYFHGAPYDLYAIEYGDSVSTVGFHAAGMTFEKHNGASIAQRTREQYLAMWASLYAGASDKQRLLTEWRQSHVDARDQGSLGMLKPNGLYFDGKRLYQQVADLQVRHYFFPPDPARTREIAQLVRRLQRMDVKVMQLDSSLIVPDYRPYGGVQGTVTLPAGTYWVPMNQARKHWIQAMLHEQPYSPLSVSYDVSAWSNPLLLNVAGGSSAAALSPVAAVAAPVPELPPLGAPAGALRIGLFEMPGTAGFESAGAVRHLFERVWGVAYTPVTVTDVVAGLRGIDVLLVPDGYANGGLQALGNKGQKALAAWVEAGGRYVGYLGGTELAVGAGISTAVLKPSHTAAPGTLIRVSLDPASPLAAGTNHPWVMYANDAVMVPGLGQAVARFPALGNPIFHTSGLAIGVDELANTAALVDEAVGNGRSVVFSFDPNFRGWTEGTQRLLWNALYGPNPAVPTPFVLSSKERASALDTASRALKSLPDTGGKAMRIVVSPADADLTRAVLQRYGAEFKQSTKKERTVFVIANREGLSGEEHPFAADLARELAQHITPLSISLP
jgi:hypothetical protein